MGGLGNGLSDKDEAGTFDGRGESGIRLREDAESYSSRAVSTNHPEEQSMQGPTISS